jgi:hypothetical protein
MIVLVQTGLEGLTTYTPNSNVTVTDACCPYADWGNTVLTQVRLPTCSDCLNITRISPDFGPATGSVTVTIRVSGRPSSRLIAFEFGPLASNFTTCNLNSLLATEVIVSGQIVGYDCTVTVPAALNRSVSASSVVAVRTVIPGVDRLKVVSASQFRYVSLAAYSGGYDVVSSDEAYPVNAAVDPFAAELPGSAGSGTSQANTLNTYVFIGTGPVSFCTLFHGSHSASTSGLGVCQLRVVSLC